MLPAFAAGASNDAQTESATVAATTDNSSSSSSNENVSGGGTSQDGSASASVEKDESSSDESSSASDNASSSAAAAAKAAPLLAASNASNVTTLSGNSTLPSIGASGTYQLTDNVTQSYTSFISSDVTIDLNGHTLNYTGNQSLFHVQSGGKLTIVDSSNTASNNVVYRSTVDAKNDASSIGKTASIEWNGSAPSKLTYYVTVTKLDVNTNGLGTTETCEKHEVTPGGDEVTPGGVINATNSTGANSVIYMDDGELNLQGGMITMAHASEYSGTDGHIIDVNGGTFNMSGGYVCGGTFKTGRNSHDHGGGVLVRGGSMELSGDGVIAANSNGEGGGIYNSATLTVSGGVISGNEVPVSSYGGGISSVNGTLTVSGGCITNNVMSAYCGNDGWGDHGGGGIAARGNNGSLSITGGFITGNKSQEAGGGVYAGANGAGLYSFTISGGTNKNDRWIELTSFAAYRDELRPLSFRPRAKRGVQVFANAPQGLNTGPGRLPFPNRADTIVPPPVGRGAVEFRWPSKAGSWDDLSYRVAKGPWRRMSMGGGLRHAEIRHAVRGERAGRNGRQSGHP